MISIITPIYNEEKIIVSFLEKLHLRIQENSLISEIIIVDGGSTDNTRKKIEERKKIYDWSIHITLLYSAKSRAIQQNVWASKATWTLLFFLHVDCLPEYWFEQSVRQTYTDGKQWWICHFHRVPATRYTKLIDYIYNHKRSFRCRFGDSWIIVTEKLFSRLWWFDEHFTIEEDHLFIMKLRKTKNFTLFPLQLEVSDRLFRKNWFLKTLSIYILIHGLFLCGLPQKKLLYLLHFIKWVKS